MLTPTIHIYAVGMKRKLKDPKKMGEKKEQTVNNSGKNEETATR